jgi:molybdopterin synthase sulfur carrier subunit
MNVDVKLFATLGEAAGERSVTLEVPRAATVGTVLERLESTYPGLELLDPETGTTRSVTVLRNGRHIEHFAGLETTLEAGDTVSIAPPLAGGDGGEKTDE